MFVKRFKQKISNSAVIHIGNDIFYKPVETCSSEVLNKYKSHDFILTVSHLYPYKNLELLIDSYNHLKLNEKDIYILVAGSIADQSYFNKLKLKLDIYDISKYVIFLGRVNSFSLREMYSQCKFFVFTSPYENFAYTLIEAMSCASPIITTNTTAMPETCGDAALYFSPDSEKELSEHILSFLNDENLRLKYKNMAFLKASEYAVFSEVNNKTNALLNRVLETKED
jgi:glycosyltransferase involved in cell wall biosynthesis